MCEIFVVGDDSALYSLLRLVAAVPYEQDSSSSNLFSQFCKTLVETVEREMSSSNAESILEI